MMSLIIFSITSCLLHQVTYPILSLQKNFLRRKKSVMIPIKLEKKIDLTEICQRFNVKNITSLNMKCENVICLRERNENQVVLIDMTNPQNGISAIRSPIMDQDIMVPFPRIIELQPGIELLNPKMDDKVLYWKWLKLPNLIGLVTHSAVYHWNTECDSAPSKVFDRLTDFKGIKIINYHTSHDQKQLLLIGNTAKDTNTL